jgi:hypothetical protein
MIDEEPFLQNLETNRFDHVTNVQQIKHRFLLDSGGASRQSVYEVGMYLFRG